MKAIGLRLKRTREALQMTQATFCRVVDIAQPQWNNYEKGLRRISLDPALKVCVATGATLDWIYRGLQTGLPVNLASALRAPDGGGRKRS